MKKIIWSVFLFTLLLFIPLHVFAVEFTIEETNIHANLKSDGSVDVKETHTYEFNDDFNGITRTLIPKETSSITGVKATENGSELPVEQEDNLYKIYRSGSDETVNIDLYYTINDGVEVFEDVGQFYWPFFDKSNESTYENLTITVEPPEPAEVLAAYGFDAAYDTETTTSDGKVIFHLGKVSTGTNGDIRVAYEASLFSDAPVTSFEPMLKEIQEDQAQLEQTIAARAESRNFWDNFAVYFHSALILVAAVLVIYALRKRHETVREAERQKSSTGSFPKEKMSLPAMMLFTNHGQLPISALTAALLDLVRKGNIEKISEQEFKLSHRQTDYPHEQRLIEWLFDQIADSDYLHLEDIEAYAEEKTNHEKYRLNLSAWQEKVKQEFREYDVKEKAHGPRWVAGASSLTTLPFIVLFPLYDLFLWMFVSILLFTFFLTFSIAYRPLNMEGRKLKEELKPLKISDQWKEWKKEDQTLALLYQVGMGKRNLPHHSPAPLSNSSDDWIMFLALSVAVQTSFERAGEHASVSASTGGISAGGGGAGVGGGGGGSGAF
ncbi:DUF2207 domain-containing protein [Halobacillus trueperi]|uniref:DUF2207 domain-containing protein n=1 Tax=Halobacillus trueperi TaxID=156205 RepID=UPI0037350973